MTTRTHSLRHALTAALLCVALPAAAQAPTGLTPMRARALAGVAFGIASVAIGALAARSAAPGRTKGIAALGAGGIGVILGALHLAGTTGGFGTGQGRAGAIVAVVLALAGMALGGRALARARRAA